MKIVSQPRSPAGDLATTSRVAGKGHRPWNRVYDGGSGGYGMDNKVTGVRIMDANNNQGFRVNYMNKSGQTVNPSTGQTISNKDPKVTHL